MTTARTGRCRIGCWGVYEPLFKRVEVAGPKLRFEPAQVLEDNGLFRVNLVLEYSGSVGEALPTMPVSILWTPGLLNYAPLVWAYGLTLSVPFRYEPMEVGLERIRSKFQQFYPSIDWNGRIVFDGPEESAQSFPGAMALYSGGLDSVQTIYRNYAAKPELVLLDFTSESPPLRASTRKMAEEFARTHKLPLTIVATNIEDFIDRDKVLFQGFRRLGLDWWTAVQYAIGMTGAAAPAAFARRAGTVYYASSFTEEFNVAGASDPDLEGNVAWPGARVFHDSFDRSRQQKIEALAAERPMTSVRPHLRVCHHPYDGLLNCGTCEKCLRTMAGLLVEGERPGEWGFDVDQPTALGRIKRAFADNRLAILDNHKFMWTDIRRRAAVSPKCPPDLAVWLAGLDLEPHYRRTIRRARLVTFVKRYAPPAGMNLIRWFRKWRLRRVHDRALSSS
jgi:hypothetical protein